MANQFKVAVKETTEELQHRHRRAVTAQTKERLQMLYSIKTGAVSTRSELAQRIQRDESTIYRWLKRYKQGGIEALLSVKTAPGKVSKITPEAVQQLKQRLAQPEGFNSYGQIQRWLDGAVEPATGESFFYEFSHLDSSCFQSFQGPLFSTIS